MTSPERTLKTHTLFYNMTMRNGQELPMPARR